MKKIPEFNKHRAFNKAVGPGKNPELLSVGPTFIPDYRVGKLELRFLHAKKNKNFWFSHPFNGVC